MKIFISKDELYPIYLPSTVRGWNEKEIEISEEVWEEWSNISTLFYEMQEQLRELYEGKE